MNTKAGREMSSSGRRWKRMNRETVVVACATVVLIGCGLGVLAKVIEAIASLF